MSRPVTVLAMSPDLPGRLFTAPARARLTLAAAVDPDVVLRDFSTPPARAVLADAEVLLTCWGCPPVDEAALEAAPDLRAIVHAAGTVKGHVTPAVWRRGVAVSTAADANAVPVAEYTVAMILLVGKRVFALAREYRDRRGPLDVRGELAAVGNYGRRIGIVGASRVGRRVIDALRPYDLEVVVSDPFLDEPGATKLGVRRLDLNDLLATSDIVSLHAPAVPATRHLMDRRRLGLMRDGATLINTARGWLVDHDALIEELTSGRLDAVIDTTLPEVPPPDSPLYTLPNVILTPHVAGAQGLELHRLGESAVGEVERYAAGDPFAFPVTDAELDSIA